jgi:hypothetical protein
MAKRKPTKEQWAEVLDRAYMQAEVVETYLLEHEAVAGLSALDPIKRQLQRAVDALNSAYQHIGGKVKP